MGIKPIALFGLAFLGNLVSIAQPAALAYRSSTLYGASEQAVGGATAVAALSIASIIGPQVSGHRNRWKDGLSSSTFATMNQNLPRPVH